MLFREGKKKQHLLQDRGGKEVLCIKKGWGVTKRRREEAERGRKGSLPGDGGRRTERREKVKKGEKRGGGGVWCGDVFQVQRVSGHDAAAIPPTVLRPGFL